MLLISILLNLRFFNEPWQFAVYRLTIITIIMSHMTIYCHQGKLYFPGDNVLETKISRNCCAWQSSNYSALELSTLFQVVQRAHMKNTLANDPLLFLHQCQCSPQHLTNVEVHPHVLKCQQIQECTNSIWHARSNFILCVDEETKQKIYAYVMPKRHFVGCSSSSSSSQTSVMHLLMWIQLSVPLKEDCVLNAALSSLKFSIRAHFTAIP